MITVYISIGNSDDKLTQADWASFYREACVAIRDAATTVHGQWVSEPTSAWQNACWCIEIGPAQASSLKAKLAEIAGFYIQDCVAWAEANTEFLVGI